MNDSLRVLVVDDSEADVALIVRELRRAGTNPVSQRVYDEPTMRAALESARWDVVLCDSSMPRFNTRAAVEILAEKGLKLPVIAVSGNVEEAARREAVRMGARDYVRKDQLAQLPPVIAREIRQSAHGSMPPRAAAAPTRGAHARDIAGAERGVAPLEGGAASPQSVASPEGGAASPQSVAPPEGGAASREDVLSLADQAPHPSSIPEGEAEHWASLGRMALSVARDLNDLLTSVLAHASPLVSGIEASDPAYGTLREIERAGRRAARLTRRLLSFGAGQAAWPETLDLQGVIHDIERSLGRVAGDGVDLVIDEGNPLPAIRADVSAVEEVILGMAAHARAALPGRGRLIVALSEDPAGGAAVTVRVEPRRGSGTHPAVSSQAAAAARPRASEEAAPSALLALARRGGAELRVLQIPGASCALRVAFPAAGEGPPAPGGASQSPILRARPGETVLVVEEDAHARAAAAQILRQGGYRVLEAQNAGEAILSVKRSSGRIDLLLTEVVLGGVVGLDLLEEIRSVRPELKAVFMSGSLDDAAVHYGIRGTDIPFVHKPLEPEALCRIVREELDKPSVAAPAPSTPTGATRVLLVDDEPLLLRAYKSVLTQRGFHVEGTTSAREAVEKLATQPFDVIASDLNMPEMNGLEFLRAVRQRNLDIPVILMTGQPGLDSAMRALEFGAFRYLVKPVDPQEFDDVVRRAARLHLLAQLKRKAFEVEGVADHGPGDRAGLETRFAEALRQLWMAFQPIVSWSERRVFGYEALLRTSEPTLRSPAELLDAAERLGRIHDLGRSIRRFVASAAAGAPPDVQLFVNLHSADLNDDELYAPDAPLTQLAGRVVLEITERASLEGVKGVERRVGQLRDRRFRLAVDDLGAGYAGLSSFTMLDPTIVKLDMSLVRAIDTDVRKQAIVKAMARLCGELGMLVVAEGVETVTERDTLVSLGCDLLQGYLFGKPERGFVVPTW